jgi:hypothetical protein
VPHKNTEYQRRIRQEAAAEDARIQKIVGTIEQLVNAIGRFSDEKTLEDKRKRFWEICEVLGLWAAAAVGVIAIVVSTFDAADQQKVMLGQLREAQTESRPWISISQDNGISLAEPLKFGDSGADLRLNYILRNTGKLPAFHVRFRSQILSLLGLSEPQGETRSAQSAICDPMKHIPDEFGDLVMFPGDMIPGNWPTEISKKNVSEAIERKKTGVLAHPGFVSLMLIACIDYQLPSNQHDHFQTKYAFLLGIPELNGVVMGDLKPEGTQPNVRLVYISQSAE